MNLSVGDDEDRLFEFFFKFSHKLLEGGAEEDFVGSVGDADEDDGFVFIVADLLDFADAVSYTHLTLPTTPYV